jgi:SAM-dependent methyltransferase
VTRASPRTSTATSNFDRDYYRRFYEDPKTRVASRADAARLARFVCSYTDYLGVSVRRALDLGCGLGHFGPVIKRAFRGASYVGVEYSAYLCERYGFEQGSAVDYRAAQPFDLVICRGVLPYLSDRDAARAIQNLGRLCDGVLYVEAVTREDFTAKVVDRAKTDPAMARRPRAFYAERLAKKFVPVGGGVWVAKSAGVPLYALERADVSRRSPT